MEQDINTKEEPSVSGLSIDQLRKYFELLPECFADRLAVFFPRETVI